jgi:hypothetical protein
MNQYRKNKVSKGVFHITLYLAVHACVDTDNGKMLTDAVCI